MAVDRLSGYTGNTVFLRRGSRVVSDRALFRVMGNESLTETEKERGLDRAIDSLRRAFPPEWGIDLTKAKQDGSWVMIAADPRVIDLTSTSATAPAGVERRVLRPGHVPGDQNGLRPARSTKCAAVRRHRRPVSRRLCR